MPLSLYVDGPRWRDHLTATVAAIPGLIPVAKGNGYGFGLGRLARRAEWLEVPTLAVGTYDEVSEVDRRFGGDILVLQPWRPFLPTVRYGERIIHTVGRMSDATDLAAATERPRVVLEGLTSMCRFGFALEELARVGPAAAGGRAVPGLRVEGHALHLPLGAGHPAEVQRWLTAAPAAHWYVSHLSSVELAELQARHHHVTFRPRLGTTLWLGDRSFLSVRATVLDVHLVRRGDRVGYRQRLIGRDGYLVIVAGGTSHGIALEAPNAADTARQRAVALARGGLDAVGRALSPYVVDGKQRWFVEPPHMQVSMIFVPSSAAVPEVGDEVPVQVRSTTTSFDRVVTS